MAFELGRMGRWEHFEEMKMVWDMYTSLFHCLHEFIFNATIYNIFVKKFNFSVFSGCITEHVIIYLIVLRHATIHSLNFSKPISAFLASQIISIG